MQAALSCGTHGDLMRIEALRERVLEGLAAADHLVLDPGELVSADFSFVQLIESARLQAARDGKTISLAAPAPEPVARLLEAAGLLWEQRPEDRQFWFHDATTHGESKQ